MSAAQRPRVVQLLRRPYHHQVSIERVFATVRPHLEDRFEVQVVESSHPSRGVLPRVRAALEARRLQGDVTHVTGDVHYLALLLRRRSTVLTVHDTELLSRAGRLKAAVYSWVWLRLPVARAAVVTVPSEATRSDLLAVVGGSPDRVRVVRNPLPQDFADVPAQDGRPVGTPPTVLLVGTWPNKNLDRSVAALAGLPVRVVVVGPLDERQQRLLAGSGLDWQGVTDLTDQEVVAQYRAADVLLFPSTKEGFGLPVLEAQACGRVVVTSDRPPLRDVAGGAAVLVDPEDVASIRAGVLTALGDDDLRRRLVAEGRRNAAAYAPASVAAEWAALYDEVLSAAAPSRRARRRGRRPSAPS